VQVQLSFFHSWQDEEEASGGVHLGATAKLPNQIADEKEEVAVRRAEGDSGEAADVEETSDDVEELMR